MKGDKTDMKGDKTDMKGDKTDMKIRTENGVIHGQKNTVTIT